MKKRIVNTPYMVYEPAVPYRRGYPIMDLTPEEWKAYEAARREFKRWSRRFESAFVRHYFK